eukprot:449018_1
MTDTLDTELTELANGLDIKKLTEIVRVAETAERYEDMCKFVKKLVEEKSSNQKDLDVDERNLLSVAYKNVVGAKRASWRTLSGGFDDADADLLTKYKAIVELELEAICQEVLKLLVDHLCKNVEGNGDETEVFYLKMCGDYYRYMSEFNDDDKYKQKAEEFYKKAMDVAEANLNETHPTRLGLALNFSVFYKEILGDTQKSCALAKQAFDSSIQKLDTLNDSSYKDSTLIMQLLRDNLTTWSPPDGDETIGFAVGGARDVNNFRECIANDTMPNASSITFNGLLYEYYFDTKTRAPGNDTIEEVKDDGSMLFYPSYCYAEANNECFMSVGLNSNIKAKDFKRKLLNLCIVLDKSGSMSDCFENERHNYYAQFNDGNTSSRPGGVKTKMQVANECIVDLLRHLRPKDRFGLIVFDTKSAVYQSMQYMEEMDLDALKAMILRVHASGGTNFECGYKSAIDLYLNGSGIQNDEEYDNRIIFLTDAHPNHGATNPNSLMGLVDQYSNNAHNYVYTTFVGVGLDFNAKLMEQITATRGCNYYSVQSTADFKRVMNEDFEFMVTPLVFNVLLTLKSEGNTCCIEKVYGASPQKEGEMISTGEITSINTLFPSKQSKAKGGTKGGIQLIKLKPNEDANKEFNVVIEVTFEDKYGTRYKNQQLVHFGGAIATKNDADMIENDESNFYDNKGIRKAILLCKYGELLMEWMKHEEGRRALHMDDEYKNKFNAFIPYFEQEMKQCEDDELQKELDLLRKLVK